MHFGGLSLSKLIEITLITIEQSLMCHWMLGKRINKIEHYVLAHEARLLKYSAEFMIKVDLSKDEVIEENKTLITEIAQRDEAIKRLEIEFRAIKKAGYLPANKTIGV